MEGKQVKYFYIMGSIVQATYSFMHIIHDRYDPNEHKVYIPMGKEILGVMPEMGEFENICYPIGPKGIKRFFHEIKMYMNVDHIILHGIFFGTTSLLPLLALLIIFPKYKKRLCWIEHGGDLYNWKRPDNTMKIKLVNWMNKYVRECASVIGVCHPVDEAFLKKEFDTQAVCVYSQLRTLADPFSEWERVKPKGGDVTNRPTLVQVGHNAFQLGNHIRILDMLEQFKDEEIKIVMPVSYGTTGIFGSIYGGKHYLKSIIVVAKQIFGDKVSILRKKIPVDNYNKYLWNVDIVIFDLYRQAGLGNLHALLYMNKKIFMPSGTILYDWFTSRGVEIYDTNMIPNMNYEEFIKPNVGDNKKWVMDFLTQNSYELWDVFFEELEKSKYR